MTPRQARFGVDVFTGVIIASVALALANLTWRLQGEPGVGPVSAPVVARGGDVGDIRPLIAMTPFGTAVTVVNATGSEGSVTLKGILLARPVEASVVLLATADGKVASYGIGAAVGGGVIETIAPEQITLRMPDGVQTIGFNPAAGSPGAANAAASVPIPTTASGSPPPPPPPPPTPLTGADAVRALIPQSVRGQSPSSPALPPVSVAPSASGYRIGGSPPPALAAAGIRAGDVIQRVNGAAVSSGSNEREVMARAIAAGTARVELLRDGQRVSLTIPVR